MFSVYIEWVGQTNTGLLCHNNHDPKASICHQQKDICPITCHFMLAKTFFQFVFVTSLIRYFWTHITSAKSIYWWWDASVRFIRYIPWYMHTDTSHYFVSLSLKCHTVETISHHSYVWGEGNHRPPMHSSQNGLVMRSFDVFVVSSYMLVNIQSRCRLFATLFMAPMWHHSNAWLLKCRDIS